MKKTFIILVITAFLLSGCSTAKQNTGKEASSSAGSTNQVNTTAIQVETLRVSDYFPMEKDVRMVYKGTGNEYAAFETSVDYVKDGIMQLRNSNGGTVSAVVYKLENGQLVKTFSQGEIYYRYDFTSSSNKNEILIKEPIKAGTSWTLEDGAERSITAVDKAIEVPFGKYKALEITTKRKDSSTIDYYVKGIGLVKTVFDADTMQVTSELEKLEKDSVQKQSVKLYYPYFEKEKTAYIEKEIGLKTNEAIIDVLEKELKSVPENSGLSPALTKGTEILGIKLDDEKGIATVDLSAKFVSEMNAGTLLESLLLASITNTIGNYYQKDKVIILLDGKPYESGHFLMKTGEFFKVNNEKTIQYQKP